MAASVSSPWGKPGAWAVDAEEHEDELRQEIETPKDNNTSGEAEFPSLAAAAATKPKRKKNQTVSLAEFTTYGAAKPSQPSQQTRGLTHEDLLNLPTGPRQRSAEELDRTKLGGGFKSYGMTSRNGDDSANSRWGGGSNSRVSSRDKDSNREFAPSRADEIDDWSKTKKSPVGNGYERRERGYFFDSQSKADESDSWVSNKLTETRRFSAASGAFERRGSFDSLSRDRQGFTVSGGASDSDNWGRKKEDGPGAGSVGARPKLVLQPRTLPVSNDNGGVAKPKGSNPFGDARPREAVLAEKGKDWKEIDEKLDSSKINGNKELEKTDRVNQSRWSFTNGRSGSSNDGFGRSWKKPDVDVTDSEPRPHSVERTENGDESEKGHATEDEVTEGN